MGGVFGSEVEGGGAVAVGALDDDSLGCYVCFGEEAWMCVRERMFKTENKLSESYQVCK